MAAALAGLLAAGCAGWRGARLYESGSEALRRGENALAIEQLEAAAELVPQGSQIQNHLGLAYARVGRHQEATRAFERALELDCDNRAAQHNLAVARAREEHREARVPQPPASPEVQEEAGSDGR